MAYRLNKHENHDRIEDEILANIEVAVTHKIPNLICFSGNRYDGLTDEEGIEITAEGLGRVAKAAEENNVTLVLELPKLFDHIDIEDDLPCY
jgi:hydroxypyruvate isomerase